MHRFCLLVCFFLLGLATAQEATQAPQGELAEIRIEGVSDPILESLIRVRLVSRPGVPVDEIDLEAEGNQVYNLGAFSEVSLSIEPRPVGPVLFVRVKENPPIRDVALRGVQVFPRGEVLRVLEQQNLIEEGQIYNTIRAQEAVETLQAIYRQQGYPGTIPVRLEVRPAGEAPEGVEGIPEGEDEPPPVADVSEAEAVRLIYTVNESPPLEEITFQGATVLDEARLRELFRPLENAETLNLQTYAAVTQRVAEAYEERGFVGSGVDPQRTELEGGTLRVQLGEREIVSLDTTAIGVDPSQLSLEPGDLYNRDVLLEDVQRLAEGRSSDIRIEEQPVGEEGVRVVFASGPPDSAGPIERIRMEGNTVFTDAELRERLQLEVGETFTSALAQEDFLRLAEFYADAGYVLVPEPAFNFVDGTYVQRVREVKVAGYEVDLQTEDPRTEESVITRYLPEVGSVYNQEEVERGIQRINGLQIVQLGQIGDRISHILIPTQEPDEQIVRFIARELPSRTITPSAELTTEGGVSFGADLSVIDNNLFGRAHRASASLSARTSDIGFLVGGSLSYSIPWLYADFLDFQEVPTEVSGQIFSEVRTNQPLSAGGQTSVCPDGSQECAVEERVTIGEYTQRDTGVRFGIGRPIVENLSANLSVRFTNSSYYLEPPEAVCTPSEEDEANPDCSLPREQGLQYLPQSGFSSFIGTTLAYDTRDNPEFPREGYRFTVGGGVGFGTDFEVEGEQRGYVYEQLEVGARTYLAPFENPSHVFAFRFNAGHQFGAAYPESRLFIVGNTNNEATQIRGYGRDDVNPSRTYAVGTAEYRYDFGLSTAVTQTVVGIAFADLGYASSVTALEGYFTPLLPSVGVALQLNVGFGGGLALPPLRFDYGFSPANPTGVFGFRLGFNF